MSYDIDTVASELKDLGLELAKMKEEQDALEAMRVELQERIAAKKREMAAAIGDRDKPENAIARALATSREDAMARIQKQQQLESILANQGLTTSDVREVMGYEKPKPKVKKKAE